MSRYVGEFLGTFALVWGGTGAIIANDASGGVIGHVGIALTFGLAVMTMIYAVAGPITGASMNPARSFAPALLSGNLGQVWIYLTAPFLGAVLAILSCRLLRDEGCCLAVADAESLGEV